MQKLAASIQVNFAEIGTNSNSNLHISLTVNPLSMKPTSACSKHLQVGAEMYSTVD